MLCARLLLVYELLLQQQMVHIHFLSKGTVGGLQDLKRGMEVGDP